MAFSIKPKSTLELLLSSKAFRVCVKLQTDGTTCERRCNRRFAGYCKRLGMPDLVDRAEKALLRRSQRLAEERRR
jgi:hypothetical protein